MRWILTALMLLTASPLMAQKYPLDLTEEGLTIPPIADNELRSILDGNRKGKLIWYKLPQVYQFWQPATILETKNYATGVTRRSVKKAVHGIFSTDYLKDTNANQDFPWETTLGLNIPHREGSDKYGAVNFLWLPKPIALVNKLPYVWIYPVGTIAAEVLWVKDSDGKKHIFEFRMRKKTYADFANNQELTWVPKIVRPIKNREELLRTIGLNKNADIKYYKNIYLRNPEEDEVMRFENKVERIPDLTPEWTKYILHKIPFKDVTADNWHPMSDIEFSIFPKDYSLGVTDADFHSCSQCHRQTGISVSRLIPREPIIWRKPEIIGNIRGSDGIFTWYPWGKNAIGKSLQDKPTRISVRQYDKENKTWEIYDPLKHDQIDYKLTPYVQEALATHELPVSINELLWTKEQISNGIKARKSIAKPRQFKEQDAGIPFESSIHGEPRYAVPQIRPE